MRRRARRMAERQRYSGSPQWRSRWRRRDRAPVRQGRACGGGRDAGLTRRSCDPRWRLPYLVGARCATPPDDGVHMRAAWGQRAYDREEGDRTAEVAEDAEKGKSDENQRGGMEASEVHGGGERLNRRGRRGTRRRRWRCGEIVDWDGQHCRFCHFSHFCMARMRARAELKRIRWMRQLDVSRYGWQKRQEVATSVCRFRWMGWPSRGRSGCWRRED